MTPAEVVAEVLHQVECEGPPQAGHDAQAVAIVAALAAAGLVVVSAEGHRELLDLIEEFADPDPCQFDHEGDCQAHGPTSTWPGCPHARARELLAALPEAK